MLTTDSCKHFDLASILFKAQTRMLEIKSNFRGMHKNNSCRPCGAANETQEHILELCPSIHLDNTYIVKKSDLFTKNTQELVRTVAKVTHCPS